jgi:NitT/TauT family transport system substrate-binding protein
MLSLVWTLPLYSAVVFAAQAEEPRITNVSYSSLSTAVVPIFTAEARGYFRDERLSTQFIQIRGAISVTALISGSVDFITDMGSSIEAAVRGPKLKVVMVGGDRPQFELVAHPSIRTFADLKGKMIAVSSYGSASDESTRTMLNKNGLRPDKDVMIRALGTPELRMLALKTGAVHASIFTPPSSFMAIRELGLVSLGKSADYLQSLYGGIITTEEFIQKNREIVSRFVKAALKGHLFYRAKRPDAIKILMSRLKLEDPQIGQQSYDFHVPTTTPDGTASMQLLQQVIEDRKKASHIQRPIGASDIFDFSFVKQAMSELQGAGWRP